jgi:hypothetical protein
MIKSGKIDDEANWIYEDPGIYDCPCRKDSSVNTETVTN